MPGATAKGAPYILGGDPAADIDAVMQALAEWVDARPGVSGLSTAERDALAGADLWDNRVIWNKTTARLERFNDATDTWLPAGATLDFGEVGDISASAPGDAADAGATGEVADAGHRHAREAAGPTIAQYNELRLQRIMEAGSPAPSLRRSAAVTGSNQAALTVAAGRKYVVKTIHLFNDSNADLTCNASIAGAAWITGSTKVLPKNSSLAFDMALVMNAGEVLNLSGRGWASYVDLAAAEAPARYYQHTAMSTNGVWTQIFAATENRVITSITLCNSGGAGGADIICDLRVGAAGIGLGEFTIPAGETVVIDTPIWMANAEIMQLWTNNTNSLGISVSGYPAQS